MTIPLEKGGVSSKESKEKEKKINFLRTPDNHDALPIPAGSDQKNLP